MTDQYYIALYVKTLYSTLDKSIFNSSADAIFVVKEINSTIQRCPPPRPPENCEDLIYWAFHATETCIFVCSEFDPPQDQSIPGFTLIC